MTIIAVSENQLRDALLAYDAAGDACVTKVVVTMPTLFPLLCAFSRTVSTSLPNTRIKILDNIFSFFKTRSFQLPVVQSFSTVAAVTPRVPKRLLTPAK